MKKWILITIILAGLTACNQNVEVVRDGEMLEDSPPPAASANGNPLATPAGAELDVPPFVKAYFMHLFVEALYSPPQNKNPKPDWSSPLLDPEDGRVWCTDCHVSGQIDFENIPKQKLPMTDQFENNHEFMADLMRHWVERLNSDEFFAKAKLKEPVTCLTCHETNPDPG